MISCSCWGVLLHGWNALRGRGLSGIVKKFSQRSQRGGARLRSYEGLPHKGQGGGGTILEGPRGSGAEVRVGTPSFRYGCRSRCKPYRACKPHRAVASGNRDRCCRHRWRYAASPVPGIRGNWLLLKAAACMDSISIHRTLAVTGWLWCRFHWGLRLASRHSTSFKCCRSTETRARQAIAHGQAPEHR